MRIELTRDRALAWRGGGSYRYARLLLEAPILEQTTSRPALNLALVLDRSGSMSGEKLEHARQALDAVALGLDGRDHASLTIFDHDVQVISPARRMDAAGKSALRSALAAVDAGGNTALFDGWLHGSREAALKHADAGLSRVILFSDGLANTGLTDRQAIAAHVAELRARGLSTSTIGVGVDFDEQLLRAMAEMGGGNYYFVEHPNAIPMVVRGEFGELLRPFASGIEVRAHVPAGVRLQAWNEIPSRSTGHTDVTFQLGDLAQGASADLVLNAVLPEAAGGSEMTIPLEITWTNVTTGQRETREESLAYRFVPGNANEAQARDEAVALRVVEVWAARVRTAALERNRTGDYGGARSLIEREIGFMRRYAEGLPAAWPLIEALQPFAQEVHAAMAAPARQAVFAASYETQRMRPPTARPR